VEELEKSGHAGKEVAETGKISQRWLLLGEITETHLTCIPSFSGFSENDATASPSFNPSTRTRV
jgi:hypothetical protein